MTPAEFDLRAFWTVTEALDLLPSQPRRTVSRWLRAAKIVTVNSAGVSIVTRARLESSLPELLDEMRRGTMATRDSSRY